MQTNERFGITHLSHVLRGKDDQYVLSYKHDKLDTFGSGKDYDDDFWQNVIRTITLNGYLEKDIENIGTLKVTEKGKDFLDNPVSVMISKKHDFTVDDEEEESAAPAAGGGIAYDEALYHILKSVRKKVAKDKGLPPYVIFQDPSLEEMATTYPTSKEELGNVNGVGRGTVEKFGLPFVNSIKKYVEENDITTAADVVVKSAGNKSKVKIFIIQQIDRKIELDEIAESKGLSFEELLDEMEQICYSGTKLNIDYCIDQYIDEERREEIFDYFLSADNDSLEDAMNEFNDLGYEEEDLRLMRIKFLSEYAN